MSSLEFSNIYFSYIESFACHCSCLLVYQQIWTMAKKYAYSDALLALLPSLD